MEDIWSDDSGEKYLYRHRSAGIYAIDEILTNYVHLTPLDQLNDLNEGRLNFVEPPGGLSRRDKLAYLNRVATERGAFDFKENLVRNFIHDENAAWNQVEDLFADTHEYGAGQLKEMLSTFNIGICCFSKRPLSPTMMAHYGNNQGVVICYDSEVLRRELSSDILFSVDYVDSPVVLDQYDLFFGQVNNTELVMEKSLKNAVRSKYKDWEYEKEVRLYSVEYAGRELMLPDDAIKGVCLAMNASKQTIRVMFEVCRQQNIPLYRSTHGDGYEYEAQICEGIIYEP